MKRRKNQPRQRRSQSGFTLVEMTGCIAVIAIGLLGLASATVSGKAAMDINRETQTAAEAVKSMVDDLQSGDLEFEQIFDGYTNGVDDGKGGREAPISRKFVVSGLRSSTGDAVGELRLPTRTVDGTVELREDVAQMDLNGDGEIDEGNHANDYKLLPLTIRVSWVGARGARFIELQTLLTKRN